MVSFYGPLYSLRPSLPLKDFLMTWSPIFRSVTGIRDARPCSAETPALTLIPMLFAPDCRL
ncbi:uncharacterized protein N7482_009054, partial [Penicillium canariense]